MPADTTKILSFPTGDTKQKPADRIIGLEYLRVFATFLVVVLHAAIAYLVWKMPGLAWPVHDTHPSVIVDVIFWAVQGFIMPVFFLMSGIAAALLLEKKSPKEFIDHRRKRLFYPLLFGIVVILPLDLYTWVLGWVSEGRYSFRKLQSLKVSPEDGVALFGLSHLWFLQYLLIYSLGLIGIRVISTRWSASSIWNGLNRFGLTIANSWWGPAFIILPCWGLQWFTPRITIGFRHDFLPFATNLTYYALWFALGVVWKNGLPGCIFWMRRWRTSLTFAAVIFPIMIAAIHDHIALGEPTGFDSATVTLLIPVYSWFASTGLLGLFLTIRWPESKTIKTLSRACFWVYLAHHPIVGLFQTGLDQVAIPTVFKALLATAGTLIVTLGLYFTVIQKSWIETLLNGRKKISSETTEPVHVAEAVSKAA